MDPNVTQPLLANIVWHTRAGLQSRFATGTVTARRNERAGFRLHSDIVVRVVSRTG